MTDASDYTGSPELTTDQIAGLEPYDIPDEETETAGERGQADPSVVGSSRGLPIDDRDDVKRQPMQLLGADELQAMLEKWREIQGEFVDEPRQAIHDADALVADLMQRLTRTFAQERDQLEAQLTTSSDVSTEDMRQGLRRYRSLFERLLAA